jgi:GntR family transcriptional regulator
LQAKEELLRRIAAGEFAPGQQLPSEDLLAAELRASRASIRSTIMLLEREGVLRRRHGIGTFVNRQLPRLRSDLQVFSTIPQVIRSHGFQSRMSGLASALEPGPLEAREALDTAEEDGLLRVDRVYLADDTPAILCVDYLPTRWQNRPVSLAGFGDELLSHLSEQYGILVERIHAEVSAQNADAEIAERLAVPSGTALLVLRHTAFDQNDTPVVFGYGYHNPAIIGFEVVRRRLHAFEQPGGARD